MAYNNSKRQKDYMQQRPQKQFEKCGNVQFAFKFRLKSDWQIKADCWYYFTFRCKLNVHNFAKS